MKGANGTAGDTGDSSVAVKVRVRVYPGTDGEVLGAVVDGGRYSAVAASVNCVGWLPSWETACHHRPGRHRAPPAAHTTTRTTGWPVVIDSLTCAGNPTYESLARKGEAMTAAALATCAYDQIDEARTELEHPS